MARVRLTPGQASLLGVEVVKKRSTKRTAKGPYHTYCVTCEEHFTTQAAENRHLDANPRHCRYEVVFELERKPDE